jgi:hypothetical protein
MVWNDWNKKPASDKKITNVRLLMASNVLRILIGYRQSGLGRTDNHRWPMVGHQPIGDCQQSIPI